MPEGEILFERRKHKRVSKKLNVTYRVMEREEGKESLEAARKEAHSDDISISGIQLIGDDLMKPGDILRIDIILEEGETIATFAEIRWSRRDESISRFRTGMEFLVIKEDHINAIKRFTME